MSNKKELSAEQREELFNVLNTRFEKNMNRHTGLEWANVQAKNWKQTLVNYGRSMKWKEPAENLMW